MPAKKKPVRKSQVLPDPKFVKTGIAFEDLGEGEYFIMDGKLWLKIEEDYGLDQPAIDLLTGEIQDDLCDEKVIPVIVNLNWEVK